MSEEKSPINFNSILLLIVVGLSSWTLAKVSILGEKQASMSEQIRSLERVTYGNRP